MITHLAHAVILVLDVDDAIAFYTDKLGFELRVDQTVDGFRWVTVGLAQQPDLEFVLMELRPSAAFAEGTVPVLQELVAQGSLGLGVWSTEDCHATYSTLVERGVEFLQPPTEQPYGVEAVFCDNSGNRFSLVQPS